MNTKKIRNTGKTVLVEEAQAILAVAEDLGSSFESAVEKIISLQPGNRLVVGGIGKAGLIAQKLSATFASTGVASFFIHPAEAVHGDLGRFFEGDLMLLLSNSGQTEEIVRMLPFVRRIGCDIIAITGNAESDLARHSEIVLNIGQSKEAGPLGLAPTTSTTVMLALGDALAMAIQEERQFTSDQFARFHPGGSLGSKLLLVSEIMRTGDKQCLVTLDLSVREVLAMISDTSGRPGAAAVIDSSGRVVGIFTDGDLRRLLANEDTFLEEPIHRHMGKNPKCIAPDRLAQDAMHLMTENEIDQLLVVDSNRCPIGLLDIQDLMAVRLK